MRAAAVEPPDPSPPQASTAAVPRAPATLDDTGLRATFVTELALRLLDLSPDRSGADIARSLALPFAALQPVLESLKDMRLCETFGGGLVGGPLFRYRLTEAGRTRARQSVERCQYVGPAPVPLGQYRGYLRSIARPGPRVVTREQVEQAFAHLVLDDDLLHQIGVAVTLGGAILLHGSAGNGKSAIAQGIRTLLGGDVAVPHALEVDGQIVTLLDPVNHEPLVHPPRQDAAAAPAPSHDERWVRCRRPMVVTGGELTPETLDLAWSPSTGVYTAPVQLVANGGVLVVDDMGRQAGSLRALLNRWIVPLENGVDHLTLATGRKFDVPFTATIVFATNLGPSELGDEAFIRRVPSRILVQGPTPDAFRRIFARCCEERDLPYEPALLDAVLHGFLVPRRIALRGCHPRDLIDHALAHAAYRGRPRHLSAEILELACTTCFPDEREPASC